MSMSNHSGAALVRAYLNGRSMDDWLFGAVVWMADLRLANGWTPVLDQRLRMDIDSQARGGAVSCRCVAGHGGCSHLPGPPLDARPAT